MKKKKDLMYSIASAASLMRRGQFRQLISKLRTKIQDSMLSDEEKYLEWIRKNEPHGAAMNVHIAKYDACTNKPLFTLIMFDGNQAANEKTVDSLKKQICTHWELLIVSNQIETETTFEDRQISIVNKDTLADRICGEWIGVIHAGDRLPPFGLSKVTIYLNKGEDCEFIYSDEDQIIDLQKRSAPVFKPDWSPEYYECFRYTGNLALARRSSVLTDAVIQAQEIIFPSTGSDKVKHISEVLYHATQTRQRLSSAPTRTETTARISILIPTRDRVDLLRVALESIFNKSTYKNYEILVVDHDSKEEQSIEYLNHLKDRPGVRVVQYSGEFNFSAINNFAARQSTSEVLLFLNNDTEVIAPDWLESMLHYALRNDVGPVGAKLLYKDETIQHGGIAVGLPEIAVHLHQGFPKEAAGFMNRLAVPHNVSAVTAACMMVRRDLFLQAGGFDESLPYAYNDVDLCLRLASRGYRSVWTPHAELHHYESSSRGYETTPEKQKRLEKETSIFLNRWKDVLERGDPYYSPNLNLRGGSFSIRI